MIGSAVVKGNDHDSLRIDSLLPQLDLCLFMLLLSTRPCRNGGGVVVVRLLSSRMANPALVSLIVYIVQAVNKGKPRQQYSNTDTITRIY